MRRAAHRAQDHWRVCAAPMLSTSGNSLINGLKDSLLAAQCAVQGVGSSCADHPCSRLIMMSSSITTCSPACSQQQHAIQGLQQQGISTHLQPQHRMWARGAWPSMPMQQHMASMSTLSSSGSSAVIPRVLLRDPWPAVGALDRKRQALQACLSVLKQAGPSAALSTQHVLAAVNQAEAGKVALASEAHTRHLLEHLRHKRLIYGRSNPAAVVAQGHPDYPYLYTALPFQAMFKGSPAEEAKRQARAQQRAIKQAQKRVRRGKPPFPFFRKQALSSCFQQALVYEQVSNAVAQHALAPQQLQ